MELSRRQIILLGLIAWLAMVGMDFLLHAGILANLYTQASPFLLSQRTAFALIPLGYSSFLLMVILLIWLMLRLKIVGWRSGAVFGLEIGILVAGAFILGLASISTANPSLLLGWFIGQTLELTIAGTVIGAGLAGFRLSRLFGIVLIFVILAFIITIILQSTGLTSGIRPTEGQISLNCFQMSF
jgi:hypothetical protein